jgi:hypothetical protein
MLRPYARPITTLALAMCIIISPVCQQNSFLLVSSFDKLRTNGSLNTRFQK